jgi:cytidylate kinase
MFSHTVPDRLVSALERAHRHWDEYHAAPARPAFTIALSREAGARGAEVARVLGARLNWPVYDRELLQKIGEEMGLHATLLESVDEKCKGWFAECMESLTAGTPAVASVYVSRLVHTLMSLGAHGECVIVGRGAPQILPAATTLRVRLVAAKPDRIEAFRQRFNLSREEAARRVEETDRERTRFVKEHFHKDPADPQGYDLVLNSSRLSAADCAELIAAALRQLQARVRAS